VDTNLLPLDLILDVYLEGQLIRSIHLDSGTAAQSDVAGQSPDESELPQSQTDRLIQRLPALWIPADGRVRLVIDLRRLPPESQLRVAPVNWTSRTSAWIDQSKPLMTQITTYDEHARVVRSIDVSGTQTTSHEDSGSPPGSEDSPPDEQPPDEPHITT
jgi:hypothetical protein